MKRPANRWARLALLLLLLTLINGLWIFWPAPTALVQLPPLVQTLTLDNGESLHFQRVDGHWQLDGAPVDAERIATLFERLRSYCDGRYPLAAITENPEASLPKLAFSIDERRFEVRAYNPVSQRYLISDGQHAFLCRPELYSVLSTKREDWLPLPVEKNQLSPLQREKLP